MATYGPTELPAFFSGDADFRTWVAGVRDALETVGMVRTADTGQIDPTTVARPAINAFAGYDIFRFDDAEQATMPVFLKLEYGVGGAVDRPSFRTQFGTGSNGSGTLTGTTTTLQIRAQPSSKTAGITLPTIASGDGHNVVIAIGFDPLSINFCTGFAIERPRLADATPTTEGFFAVSWQGSQNAQWVVTDGATTATLATEVLFTGFNWVGTAETKVGVEAALEPLHWVINGNLRWGKVLTLHSTADITAGPFQSTAYLGAVRTWYSLTGSHSGTIWAGGSNHSIAMQFE